LRGKQNSSRSCSAKSKDRSSWSTAGCRLQAQRHHAESRADGGHHGREIRHIQRRHRIRIHLQSKCNHVIRKRRQDNGRNYVRRQQSNLSASIKTARRAILIRKSSARRRSRSDSSSNKTRLSKPMSRIGRSLKVKTVFSNGRS
jgi:hypothetical protein